MAFKMNHPIIKGTALHKASIAKAKTKRESIVAQTRTAADPSLVEAGSDLGKSYVPHAIDYTLRSPEIEIPKKEKEKEKEKDIMGCMDTTANNYNASATKDDGSCTYEEEEATVEEGCIQQMSCGKGFEWSQEACDCVKIEEAPVEEKKQEECTGGQVPDGKGGCRDLVPGVPTTMEDIKKMYEEGEFEGDFDVEAYNKEMMRKEEEKQARIQAKKEAAEVKKAEKEAKKIAKQKEKEEIEKKNIEIRKRNQLIKDAREHYGPDVRLTQDKLDEYASDIAMQENLEEIEEIDDLDIGEEEQTKEITDVQEPEKTVVKPQVDESTTDLKSSLSEGRQRQLDEKYDNAGPNVRANMIADGYVPEEQREGESAMEKRDDRIWRNAKKSGVLRSNMRKSGYVPHNER